MAATLERSRQEGLYNLKSHFRRDKTGRHHKHIRIVMLTRKCSKFRSPADSSTDTLMLVQRHRNTITTPAHSNSRVRTTLLDRQGARMRIVRIVATGFAICSEVNILNIMRFQITLYYGFKLKTRMIATQSYRQTFFQNCHTV